MKSDQIWQSSKLLKEHVIPICSCLLDVFSLVPYSLSLCAQAGTVQAQQMSPVTEAPKRFLAALALDIITKIRGSFSSVPVLYKVTI